MTAAVTLITYVWHYLVARLLYDQLLRPLFHGHGAGIVLLACVATGAYLLGRSRSRRT